MAAAYAAVVPVLEIPSGILADRWSRRGVLLLAGGCGLLSVLVAALSAGVTSYIVSAMILGAFFALQSGTVDSIVYDTLLEETGSADGYEKHFGRIQMWNSAALTGSALLGGVLAGLTSPRLTYVITLPCAVAGLLLLLRFREPTLHRRATRATMRTHLAATWRAIAGRPRVAAIIAASILTAAAMQMLFEFGPLWLLALGVATTVFGPYTAGMTATLGLGGVLAARLHLDRPGPAATTTAICTVCALALVAEHNGVLVITAQIVLTALLAAGGIHLSRLLHDATPSDLRTGVASGASTLSWLTFLPSSLLFGTISRHSSIHSAGWIVLALVLTAGLIIVALGKHRHSTCVSW